MMSDVQHALIIPGLTQVSIVFRDTEGRPGWYDGVVTASKGGEYTVHFDDGDVEVFNWYEIRCGALHYQAWHAVKLIDLAFLDLDDILDSSDDIDCRRLKEKVSLWALNVRNVTLK